MTNPKRMYGTLLTILLAIFCIVPSVSSANGMIVRKDNKIILANNHIQLTFSDGDFFNLLDFSALNSSNSWIAPSNGLASLWGLTLIGPNGINPDIEPMNGVYQGATITENTEDKASVTFTWKMRLSKNYYYPVRIIVSLTKDSGLSDWRIETDLPKGWTVTKADFPRIVVNRSDDTKLIMPGGWGTEVEMDGSAEHSARYPSWQACVQLFCLHDTKEALYYATHDKHASLKRFSIRERGNRAILSTEIFTAVDWTPEEGGTFTLPFSTSIGIDTEGWQSAVVNWYKPFTYTTEWGSKTFESRKTPEWLLNADMWLRPHFTTETTIRTMKEGMEFFGPETASHWYRWHQIEYDVDYPEYFPALDNFKKEVEAVQKMGGHVVPYINGRLWDPQSVSYQERDGAKYSCRKPDGNLYIENYGSLVPNSVTCPSTDVWQKTIADLVNRMQNELGVNGVYIDQIGAATGVPCWNKEHNHPLGGGYWWHKSYRKMISDIRKNQLKPDNILITEDLAECYMDLFDVMLAVNTPHSKSAPVVPLYTLIYSDRMMVNCFLYYYLGENVADLTFQLKNALGLLWGTQIGWVKPELIMAPEARESAEFLRDMVNFRKKQHDLIYGGTFVKEVIPTGDNPILELPDMANSPAVRGAHWTGPKGNSAILLVNIDSQAHEVTLPNGQTILMKAKTTKRIDL